MSDPIVTVAVDDTPIGASLCLTRDGNAFRLCCLPQGHRGAHLPHVIATPTVTDDNPRWESQR